MRVREMMQDLLECMCFFGKFMTIGSKVKMPCTTLFVSIIWCDHILSMHNVQSPYCDCKHYPWGKPLENLVVWGQLGVPRELLCKGSLWGVKEHSSRPHIHMVWLHLRFNVRYIVKLAATFLHFLLLCYFAKKRLRISSLLNSSPQKSLRYMAAHLHVLNCKHTPTHQYTSWTLLYGTCISIPVCTHLWLPKITY